MSAFANGTGEDAFGEEAVPRGAAAPGAEEPTRDAADGPMTAEGPAFRDDEVPAAPGGEDETTRLAAERDEYLDALRRLQAEFDNYRKRTARQQAELLDRAAESLLERLLPVLDAFDLALQHHAESESGGDAAAAFGQIASLLRDALAKDGLERIDAVGVHFDPVVHDAVAHLPATDHAPSGEPGTPGEEGEPARSEGEAGSTSATVVAQVLRAGYRLKGRVLRPAMVTVKG